jgi:Pyruvate ferredoxin/flavodoxin oxidoreductase.
MLGALMEVGGLGLPKEAFGKALEHTFEKKPRLISFNLEMLDAGVGFVSGVGKR